MFTGSPREWRDRTLPFEVPPDSGTDFVDQNSSRLPAYPLLPLFRAVDVMVDESAGDPIDWVSVDFISERNGLRKLLRWIADEDESAKAFRIDMELAGERTVLLNRWDEKTNQGTIPSRPVYGFNFEKESTSVARGCEGSTGHHRVVKFVRLWEPEEVNS